MGRSFYDTEGQAVERFRGRQGRGFAQTPARDTVLFRWLETAGSPRLRAATQRNRPLENAQKIAPPNQGHARFGSVPAALPGIESKSSPSAASKRTDASGVEVRHDEQGAMSLEGECSARTSKPLSKCGIISHRFIASVSEDLLMLRGLQLPKANDRTEVADAHAAPHRDRCGTAAHEVGVAIPHLARWRSNAQVPQKAQKREARHRMGGKFHAQLRCAKAFRLSSLGRHVEGQKAHTHDLSNSNFVNSSDNAFDHLGLSIFELLGFHRNNCANPIGTDTLLVGDLSTGGRDVAGYRSRHIGAYPASSNGANKHTSGSCCEREVPVAVDGLPLTHEPESLSTVTQGNWHDLPILRELWGESRLETHACERRGRRVQMVFVPGSADHAGVLSAAYAIESVDGIFSVSADPIARLHWDSHLNPRTQIVRASVPAKNYRRNSLVISGLDRSPTLAMDGKLRRRVSVMATNHSIAQSRKTSGGFSELALVCPSENEVLCGSLQRRGTQRVWKLQSSPKRRSVNLYLFG